MRRSSKLRCLRRPLNPAGALGWDWDLRLQHSPGRERSPWEHSLGSELALECCSGPQFPLWKEDLLCGAGASQRLLWVENGSCSHSRAHSRILWCRAPLPGSGCAQCSRPGRNLGMIPPEPFFPVSRAPHPKQTQGSGEKRGLPDFPKGTSQRGGLTPATREKHPDHIPEHPKPWDCVPAPSPGRGLCSQGEIRAENSRPPCPGLFPVQLFHEIPRSKVHISIFLAAPRIPRRERGHQTCSGVFGNPILTP